MHCCCCFGWYPLLLQDKSRVEIVVVDAGCKDNTMAAVASLKLDVKIRYDMSMNMQSVGLFCWPTMDFTATWYY